MTSIKGMIVYKPDANYIFCRLPDHVKSGPQIAKDLFIKHNMLVKDCVGKSQPDADRYLRIASRRVVENNKIIEALIDVLAINGEDRK
jgi:threonine-phosphate decarboxylase